MNPTTERPQVALASPPPAPAAPRPAAPAVALSLPQILDATAACLAESGYDGTTIRRIAGRLGCAVGSIYRYCTDKRALLSAVSQRRFEPVVQAIDDHVSVAHTAAQYVAIAAEDPQQYRLMFWLASLEPADEAAAVPAMVRRIIDGWARQVGDPRAAQRLWTQLHGGLMLGLAAETILAEAQPAIDAKSPRSDPRREAQSAAAVDRMADGAPVAVSPARDDLTLL